MGAPKKYPRFMRLSAVHQVTEKGRAISVVAREIGVTDKTLSSWIKEESEPRAPLPNEPAQEPEKPKRRKRRPRRADEGEPLGTLETLKRVLADITRRIGDAEEDGQVEIVQKLGRDAGNLGAIVARLEKAEAQDDDVLKFPRSEIKAAQASLLEKVRMMASKPLHCAECGRRLRAEMAGGRLESDGE